VLNVYIHKRKARLTQQTKCPNDVTKKSVSGREKKTNKQTKIHETDVARHEAYYSC